MLIKCSDLSFSYNGITVLSGLNFTVNKGDCLCVIGENGSGKSTLIKGLLGFIKPDTGKIEFDRELVKSDTGYLPQQKQIKKDFPASVYEVVLSGTLGKMGFNPFYKKKDKELAEENMVRLSITEIKSRCFRELSGGQQQRVLLARALCAGGKMLALDEPTTGLDSDASGSFFYLLKTLKEKYQITSIVVTHDIPAAMLYSTHILRLKNKQLFWGTTEEYKLGAD